MPPEEFDAFIAEALVAARTATGFQPCRQPRQKLIKRINRGLPEDITRRYDQLARRRKKGNSNPGGTPGIAATDP